MDSSSASNLHPESPEDGNDRLIDSSLETTGNTENAEDSETIWSNSTTLERRLDIEEPTSLPRGDTGPNPVADEDLQNMDDLLSGASATYGHPAPAHHQLFLQEQQGQDLFQYSISAAGFSRFRSRSSYPGYSSYSLTDNSDINSVNTSYIDSFTSRKKATDHDATEKCVICISNFIENEELRELRCTHKFHRMCIDEWLVNSNFCPICRTDFRGQSSGDGFGGGPTREFNVDRMFNNP